MTCSNCNRCNFATFNDGKDYVCVSCGTVRRREGSANTDPIKALHAAFAASELTAYEPSFLHGFRSRLATAHSGIARGFTLKGLAVSLFATDPRVQELVGRVTDTKAPRWTRKARLAREHVDYPVLEADEDGPTEESVRAAANTPRARRLRALDVAWRRERGLRHDAIRRAIAIFRGTR